MSVTPFEIPLNAAEVEWIRRRVEELLQDLAPR